MGSHPTKKATLLGGLNGGGGGIRTHGTLARTTVFKTAPINRSGTPPSNCFECIIIIPIQDLLSRRFFKNFLGVLKLIKYCYNQLMSEESLKSSNVAIRKIRTPILVLLSIVTFGVYWYVWLWKLITDINTIYPKKYIHRVRWFCALIILQACSIFMIIKGIQKEFLVNCADLAWFLVQLLLALQILKNIEQYVKEEFDLDIKHNIFGWLFFGCFYINYRINRLAKYIKRELKWKIRKLKRKKECQN